MSKRSHKAIIIAKALVLTILLASAGCKKSDPDFGYYYPQLVGKWVDEQQTCELTLAEDGQLKVQHTTERGISMKLTKVQQFYPVTSGEITLICSSERDLYVTLTWYTEEDILALKGHDLRRE